MKKPGGVRLKVKTGCLTCKTRRVKCDEQKPACNRCVSTGRVCDGYGIWGGGGNGYGSGSREANISLPKGLGLYNSAVPLQGATEEEAICFDFFRQRTAVKLPGVFESNFWGSLIFQASSVEPAVLHATIALASAHRSEEVISCDNQCASLLNVNVKNNNNPPLNRHDLFALRQYNKAISALQVHMSNKDQKSLRVALITCMMFICLELLRGEFGTVNTHLRNGLNLLSQVQGRADHKRHIVLRPEAESVDDNLIEAFARLNVQSALFGLGSQHLYIVAQDIKCGPDFNIPKSFSTVYEVRQYLDGLLNATFHFVETCRDLHPSCPPPLSLIHQQSHLRTALSDWLSAYETSRPNLLPNLTPRTALGLPLLRIYHTMITIMLHTSLSARERAFDHHESYFASMITQSMNLARLAELPLTHISENFCDAGHMRFTVDMGFIPPIYYTALKCRDPVVRRQAINLLFIAPHREGMWDPAVVARIAERVMHLEEGKYMQDVDSDLLDRLAKMRGQDGDRERLKFPVIPEERRFRDIKVIMSEDMKAAGKLMYRRRRYEGDGGWETREEEFDFGDVALAMHEM